MITSYSTLKTSIADYLHRTDLTTVIPEFIVDAEARIYNDLRIRAMETAFTGTTSGGTIALPSGFLEWVYLSVDGGRALIRKDAEWIATTYPTQTGTPVYFARDGSNLVFGPEPDADTDLAGRYYKRLDALSDSNATNWFITDAPDLIRYAALCEAAPYLGQDTRVNIWEQKYQTAKERIKRAENREKFSGSANRVQAG